MGSGRTTPIIWCLAAAALFGASTPAAKALEAHFGPWTLAGLFYLGAAAAVLPFSFRGGSPALRRKKRNLLMLLGAVVFGGGVGPVLLLTGLSMTQHSASVALWLNLETAGTALLAWLLFREHLDARTWIAAGLTVTAAVLLAAPSGFGDWMPALLVSLGCLCWGMDNNLTALVDGFTPQQTTLVKGLVAGSAVFGLSFVFESPSLSPLPVLSALTVGGLAYGASIVLYIKGAQHLGATRSQILFSTSPFLGGVFAWVFLGESVLLVQIGAAVVMIVAIRLLLTGKHEHGHQHDPQSHAHDHRHDDGHHEHIHPGLPAWIRHTHEHDHGEMEHTHPHAPDLHHRHSH